MESCNDCMVEILFFFQAEDGIRDIGVTGVQTCALPIYVYNAQLSRALVHVGAEVHLLSQERSPAGLAFVDAAGDWDTGALAVRTLQDPVRCTVYRPDIAGLLPVYVADRYDGVEARPFLELTDAEIERYVERNVAAVREVAERVRPDVALANHLVMGPAILARALGPRSEEHTSELQSRQYLVCRLLLEKKKLIIQHL